MESIKLFEFTEKTNVTVLDWLVVAGFIFITILISLFYTRRSRKSVTDYFASGQGVPWWILGTSMVATTFAADTPLAIAGLVVTQGIWGNWFYWSQVPQFLIGVYFFSRLWRRAGILTDNELVNVRYSGKAANWLRGFRAIYFAVPYNAITMGFVILAMTRILELTFNVSKLWGTIISVLITMGYTAISGLWGVLATSFFQFFLAMGMTIYLAVIAVGAAGGFPSMLAKLSQIYGQAKASSMLSIIPQPDAPNMSFTIFLLYILFSWWTTGPTDGGAYFAQRMISAKNEKHAFLGYYWFNIWHVVLRPWPWIIVGIAAAVLFPGIASKNPLTGELEANPELGYIAVMLKYLKPGLLGLMFSAFLAAFMSTISAQINWGASYLVNDLYKPFIKKNASEKHYVRVSVIAVVFSAILGGIISFFMKKIFTGWLLLWAINAGIGVVYIARWYWWRVNAWSEISAIASLMIIFSIIFFAKSTGTLKTVLIVIMLINIGCLIAFGLTKKEWRKNNLKASIFSITVAVIAITLILLVTLPEKNFPWTLIYTLPMSLSIWLTVTILTKPTDENVLTEFYRRVHPGGIGWKRISAKIPQEEVGSPVFTKNNIIGCILGIASTYTALVGFGKLIFGNKLLGSALLIITAILIYFIIKFMGKEKWEYKKTL
ncbi:MAG: sodium:proline symporter [Candidatus Neomarinimicrobiota bacterium]|nr:MAG: sodium:proline symporter [Candidatus Neomarinimicrobiota bacterium]